MLQGPNVECGACSGTGDKLGRGIARTNPAFQQCPDCAGAGRVLDLSEYEDAVAGSKKVRLVAANGKFEINGTRVTPRYFNAVLALAMRKWTQPEPAQQTEEGTDKEGGDYGESEKRSEDRSDE